MKKIIVNPGELVYNALCMNMSLVGGLSMYTEKFIAYLKNEKKMSPNTLEAYFRDVREFIAFEGERGNAKPEEVTSTDIIAFLNSRKNMGKSSATVNRKLASVRAFFNFLMEDGLLTSNPTTGIRSPRIEKKEIEYLSLEEIDKLITAPDSSVRGVRDRAILEVLYATGIRVTELIEADVEDINLRMGFITCAGEHSKARIVPLGRPGPGGSRKLYIRCQGQAAQKRSGGNRTVRELLRQADNETGSVEDPERVRRESRDQPQPDSEHNKELLRSTHAAERCRPQIHTGAHGARGYSRNTGIPCRHQEQDKRRIRPYTSPCKIKKYLYFVHGRCIINKLFAVAYTAGNFTGGHSGRNKLPRTSWREGGINPWMY